MKKTFTAFVSLFVFLICALITGCGNDTASQTPSQSSLHIETGVTENGLTFVKAIFYIKDHDMFLPSETDFESVEIADDKDVYRNYLADSYVCIVEKDAPAEIEIPDIFQDYPVFYVTSASDSDGSQKFSSITFGKNVKYVAGFALNGECSDMKLLYFPGNVEYIINSFSGCDNLQKITAPGAGYYIDSFNGCSGLETLSLSGGNTISGSFNDCDNLTGINLLATTSIINSFNGCDRLVSAELKSVTTAVNSSFDNGMDFTLNLEGTPIVITDCFLNSSANIAVPSQYLMGDISVVYSEGAGDPLPGSDMPADVEIGTAALLEYSDYVDRNDIYERAYSHIYGDLDPEKEIDPSESKQYANLFDGPVLTVASVPTMTESSGIKDGYSRASVLAAIKPVYHSIAEVGQNLITDYYSPNPGNIPSVYFVAEKYIGDLETYRITINGIETYNTESYNYMNYRISVWDIETDELICWFTYRSGYAPDWIGNDSLYTESDIQFFSNPDGSPVTPLTVLSDLF